MSLANLLSESLRGDDTSLEETGKSIYHAPVEDQVAYILRILRDRGDKGASIRHDTLPSDGVREVQERGLASADRGSLYITPKGRKAVSESVVGGDDEGDDEEGLEETLEEIDFAYIVEATNGKVSTFLTVFSSILTQYDQLLSRNEAKRGRMNIHRLGHYLNALEKIRAAVQGSVNDDSKEAVAKLRAAIDRGFTTGNPGDKLRKVVDAYLEKGTLPKIPISKEVRAKIAAEKRAARAAKSDMPLAAESDAWVEGLEDIELAEWGSYGRRRAYSNDPRWISAKYNGIAEDGTRFRKGDRVLYYPSTKTFYVGQDAERNWKDFLSAKGDEEGIPYAEDVDLLDEEGGHYFRDGSSVHVDTAFINAIGKAMPGFSLQHIGMGEFSLKGPDGEIEFDRMRGKSFPGMSGRSHKLYGPAELIKKLLAAMKGKAQEVTESGERTSATSKVEELESVLAEALGAPNVQWMERMVEQAGEIGRTMANRISHAKKGGGDEAWLRGALLEEVKRMEQTMKLMRRRLEV